MGNGHRCFHLIIFARYTLRAGSPVSTTRDISFNWRSLPLCSFSGHRVAFYSELNFKPLLFFHKSVVAKNFGL